MPLVLSGCVSVAHMPASVQVVDVIGVEGGSSVSAVCLLQKKHLTHCSSKVVQSERAVSFRARFH